MQVRLNTRVMESEEYSAKVLRAIMFAVFEDFIDQTSPEDFQTRFGTNGTECLSHWTKVMK